MAEPNVFFVHLRRPGPNDPRTDPIYEFGSFGCTKCHSKNLFHPGRAEALVGARLAFVQGGRLGSRLVFLTPPITVTKRNDCWLEARWAPARMPFKYSEAPILVRNGHPSDFNLVEEFAQEAEGRSIEGCLCSKIRSRAKPLEPKLAQDVITIYEHRRAAAPASAIAETYNEALPYVRQIDRNREDTYRRLIRDLEDDTDGAVSVLQAGAPLVEIQAQSHCGRSRRL